MNRLIAALALIVLTTPILACECAKADFDLELREASSVFEGKVTKIKNIRLWYMKPSLKMTAVVLHFKVDRVWKGPVQRTIKVTQFQTDPYTGADCALLFEKGKNYLVFASQNKDAQRKPLMTNGCRTKEIKGESEWLKRLGAGEKPW